MKWFIEWVSADAGHFLGLCAYTVIFAASTAEVVRAFRRPARKE